MYICIYLNILTLEAINFYLVAHFGPFFSIGVLLKFIEILIDFHWHLLILI